MVLNNGVMTHYDSHMPTASQRYGSNALGGDYSAVAAGLGVHGERVEAPNALAPAIERALAANCAGTAGR